MVKLSEIQVRALAKFKDGKIRSPYLAQESLSTLQALVKKGKLVNVTPFTAGGMFSPRTHYQFKLK